MKEFDKNLIIYYFIENNGAIIDDNNGMVYNFRWMYDFEGSDTLVAFTDEDLPDGRFNMLILYPGHYCLDNNNNIHNNIRHVCNELYNVCEVSENYFKSYFWIDHDPVKNLYSSKSKTVYSCNNENKEDMYYKDFFRQLKIIE